MGKEVALKLCFAFLLASSIAAVVAAVDGVEETSSSVSSDSQQCISSEKHAQDMQALFESSESRMRFWMLVLLMTALGGISIVYCFLNAEATSYKQSAAKYKTECDGLKEELRRLKSNQRAANSSARD